MHNRKQLIMIATILLIITVLGIGFAAFSNNITISSQAQVNPNSETFKVVFTKTSGKEDTNPIVPSLSVNTLSATNGKITNGTFPTIEDLHVVFTEPGQSATYTFYVYNKGSYAAYLNSITYKGNKTCTPDGDASTNLVNNACNSITLQVNVDGTSTTSTLQNITNNILNPGMSKPVTVTISYASNGTSVDGPFSVSFPDISLYYTTLTGVNEEYSDAVTCTRGTDSFNYTRSGGYKISATVDTVTCNDEVFYVMNSDENTTTMITKWFIETKTDKPKQTEDYANNTTVFAEENYWVDNIDSYPINGSSSNQRSIYNSSSLVYQYVQAYKDYLNSIGLNVIEARIVKYSEYSSDKDYLTSRVPSGLSSTNYWIDNVQTNYIDKVWRITSNNAASPSFDNSIGVRAVITISNTNIE